MPDVPQHITFPLDFDEHTGDFTQAPQDSAADVRSRLVVLLRMPQGHWPEIPEFGTPELVFSRQTVDIPGIVRGAVSAWEPDQTLLTDDVIQGALRTLRVTGSA